MSLDTNIYYRSRRSMVAEINVVPYIDVMLVLLVIFMITTPLLSQGVDVNLPQSAAKTLSEGSEPLIMTIDKDGQYFLNSIVAPEKPLIAQELLTRLAAELNLANKAGEKRAVLVKADKDVDYGRVVQAMLLAQKAGVASVGLVTEPEPEVGRG